jgi:hypothetical protein
MLHSWQQQGWAADMASCHACTSMGGWGGGFGQHEPCDGICAKSSVFMHTSEDLCAKPDFLFGNLAKKVWKLWKVWNPGEKVWKLLKVLKQKMKSLETFRSKWQRNRFGNTKRLETEFGNRFWEQKVWKHLTLKRAKKRGKILKP